MGQHEPYWRTNSSYSPPHPARWDFQLQPEPQFGSNDGAQLFGSSTTSTNSKESRGWVRGNQFYNNSNHPYSSDGGAGIFLSGSSDMSQGLQWTPPAIQEIRADEFEPTARRGMALGQSSFRTAMEGTSENLDSGGSTSFRSDSSESEPKSRSSSHHNHTFSTRRSSFMSKPIYPMSFLRQTSPGEPSNATSARSSMDFADVSETFEPEISNRASINPPEALTGPRCGYCERLLSQRSPWGSRRIVRSGDMPVTGVLPCSHVFHAECLEQTTPKIRKNDPPCPICLRSDDENCPEVRIGSRARTGFPRLRPCGEVGDCVEGALQAPARNTMLLLNRNRVKKSLSMKSGSTSREFPGKVWKSGSYSSQHFGSVGCSKSGFVAGPSVRR